MDLRSPNPYWIRHAANRRSFPPLREDAETEIVVVGAGVTGALVAHELVRRGYDVVVIDRRPVAHGSTAASTALLLYELDPEFAGVAASLSPLDAERTYLELHGAIAEIGDVARGIGAGEFTPRPCLYFASEAGHVERLRTEFRHRTRLGLDVEWLDDREVRRGYGADRVAAIRSHGEAHVNPYDLARGILDHPSPRLHAFGETAATSVRYDQGVHVMTEGGATIHAQRVVFATGYETRLHPDVFPARHFSTYAIATNAGAMTWEDHAMFWETRRPYLYGRCTADGRLMVGGCNDDYDGAAARDARIPARTATVSHDLQTAFPGLRFQVEEAWAGTFSEARDGLPFVGADPAHPQAQFLLGYGANGTVFAQVGAKLIADRLEGIENTFTAFSPRRNSV